MNPFVNIIILHWKKINDTKECLVSIFNLEYDNFHVVVVNNDELNFPSDILKLFPKISIINNGKNLGYARGNNIGIQRALDNNSEYVFVLNNDTIVHPECLQKLIQYALVHPQTVISPVMYRLHSYQIENCGGFLLPILGTARLNKNLKKTTPDYLSGAGLLVKSEVFRKVGFFEERFFSYFEDADWSLRARQSGFELRILPECLIWHKHSASTGNSKGWGGIKAFYVARNSLLFARISLKGMLRYIWIFGYLIFGSPLHLIMFCRSLETFRSHCRGIIDGLTLKLS